jgi:hypothetical protein
MLHGLEADSFSSPSRHLFATAMVHAGVLFGGYSHFGVPH